MYKTTKTSGQHGVRFSGSVESYHVLQLHLDLSVHLGHLKQCVSCKRAQTSRVCVTNLVDMDSVLNMRVLSANQGQPHYVLFFTASRVCVYFSPVYIYRKKLFFPLSCQINTLYSTVNRQTTDRQTLHHVPQPAAVTRLLPGSHSAVVCGGWHLALRHSRLPPPLFSALQ